MGIKVTTNEQPIKTDQPTVVKECHTETSCTLNKNVKCQFFHMLKFGSDIFLLKNPYI